VAPMLFMVNHFIINFLVADTVLKYAWMGSIRSIIVNAFCELRDGSLQFVRFRMSITEYF